MTGASGKKLLAQSGRGSQRGLPRQKFLMEHLGRAERELRARCSANSPGVGAARCSLWLPPIVARACGCSRCVPEAQPGSGHGSGAPSCPCCWPDTLKGCPSREHSPAAPSGAAIPGIPAGMEQQRCCRWARAAELCQGFSARVMPGETLPRKGVPRAAGPGCEGQSPARWNPSCWQALPRAGPGTAPQGWQDPLPQRCQVRNPAYKNTSEQTFLPGKGPLRALPGLGSCI